MTRLRKLETLSIWLVIDNKEELRRIPKILPQKNLVQQDNNKVLVIINKEAATDKLKTNKKETLFNMSFSHVTATSELGKCTSVIRKLLSARKDPEMPLSGRLKHFVETWKILTKDLEILELMERYYKPFHKNQVQQNIQETSYMNLDQRHQVQVEIDNMLRKGAICKASHLKEKLLRNVFLVANKGRSKPSSNQLKAAESIHIIPVF